MLPLRPMATMAINKPTLPVMVMALTIPPLAMRIMASLRIVYHAMACRNPQLHMIARMLMQVDLMIVAVVKNVISLVH